MYLIDTHTHLYLEEFNHDRNAVIERAIEAGIVKMILPNIDRTTIESQLHLSDTYPTHCFSAVGLHPSSVNKAFEKEMYQIENWLSKQKFYAIGETGMDLYRDKTFCEQQKDAFRIQIELAKKHQLPVIIHSRNAFDEIFSIIDDLNDKHLKGIFHCFTGTIKQAEKIIDYGNFKLAIGGIVTFKNTKLDEVVKKIDLKHIVLETDAPYLAPSPHRAKRNESSYVAIIAKKIADLTHVSFEEVATTTTRNAENIFEL